MTRALLGHGVVQIEKLAIANQVLSVGLREFLFRVVKASLCHFGCELGSDRVPMGIDDCPAFRSVRIGIEANWRCTLFAANRLNNVHFDFPFLANNRLNPLSSFTEQNCSPLLR